MRQKLHSHNPNNLDRFPEIKKKSGHLSLITHHQSPGTISSHRLGWGVGDAIHSSKNVFLATKQGVSPQSDRAHPLNEGNGPRFYLTGHKLKISHFIRVNNMVPSSVKCFQIKGPSVCFHGQIQIFVINSVMAYMQMGIIRIL